MDAPYGELESRSLQCFVPRQDVLIDAIDERAVQVEKKGRSAGFLFAAALSPVFRTFPLCGA
jgi:hypothetical protein